MLRNIKISIVLVAMSIAFGVVSGCKKFTEPEPYNPPMMEPTMTLAQFKAMYKDTPIEITDDSIVLEGKVISSDRTGNVYRSLYIEDETAGLEVKIGKTGLYNDYKLGQTIYIKPKYLCLGAYGESVQLGAVSVEEKYETSYIDAQELINRTIIRGPYGEELPPHEITSGSMINESMVCRYVRLNNAVYQGGADGLRTWAVKQDASLGIEAAYGQQTFKVDGKEVVVRTSGYAAFADVEVGMETGDVCNITGILTKFYDTYQLVLLQVEDVERLD
ncbi:MAG: hypothetical protein J6V04_04375 [Bacteroidales bacterium]|nr:hypothetical protein [Bacteroidales bacterium]